MRAIKSGSVDQSTELRILNSADGTPATGLAWNTAGLSMAYRRTGGLATAIALADLAGADAAHADSGFKEIDAAKIPGQYRIDLPDAACAGGAASVTVGGAGTGVVVMPVTHPLVAYDAAAAADLGLTDFASIIGFLDTEIAAILQAAGTDIPALIGALNDLDAATVLAQALAALDTALPANPTAGSVNDRIKAFLDAAVSSRLAAAGYTAPDNAGIAANGAAIAALNDPTAAAVADAVWDEALAGHAGAGTAGAALAAATAAAVADAVWDEASADHGGAATMGGKLNAAGGAADPLGNAVPGAYPPGSAGAKLGLLGTGKVVAIAPVALGGDVTVTRGDSYLAAGGRQLRFTDTDGVLPDLTGATIELRSRGVSYDGSSPNPGNPQQLVDVELSAAETTAMRTGRAPFAVRAEWVDGRVATLVFGDLTVDPAP
jgi:hypothetical protein